MTVWSIKPATALLPAPLILLKAHVSPLQKHESQRVIIRGGRPIKLYHWDKNGAFGRRRFKSGWHFYVCGYQRTGAAAHMKSIWKKPWHFNWKCQNQEEKWRQIRTVGEKRLDWNILTLPICFSFSYLIGCGLFVNSGNYMQMHYWRKESNN